MRSNRDKMEGMGLVKDHYQVGRKKATCHGQK